MISKLAPVLVHRLGWRHVVLAMPLAAFATASLQAQDAKTQDAKAQDAKAQDAKASLMTPHRTPADTARMAWGHQNYASYTTADMCDRAVESVRAEVWRTRVQDTVSYTLASDTVPTAALAVARACGSRFAVSTTDARDLWSLFRIALTTNDDAKARQVVARQLTLRSSTFDRAKVFMAAITMAMQASPPRIVLARDWMRQLDALGDQARAPRYVAQLAFFEYWHRLYDVDSLRAAANAALSLARTLPVTERETVDLLPPYQELFWIANTEQDLKKEQAILDTALMQTSGWRGGQASQWLGPAQAMLSTQRKLYGKPTKPFEAPYWYNDGGNRRPVQGTMALLVRVDPTCGAMCYPLYTVLRQLKARYGTALDIAVMTETQGFSVGTGPLSPADEAKQTAHYFLEHLALPVALLVDESPAVRTPDGRIIRRPSPTGAMFQSLNLANAIVIDRDRHIRWIGELRSFKDIHMTEAAIERAKVEILAK